MMKVLLIAAHPDDIEFFASYLCLQSVKAGWEVHQLLSCCDEYGTSNNEFKGNRIQKIRRNEMIQAAAEYSSQYPNSYKIQLHWMNYIDGHVPHNRMSIKRMKDFIVKINPTIVAGPDPFIYFDGHRDHVATAKNYYNALELIYKKKRPKLMLYWQSLMPDFFLPPIKRKSCLKAWKKHQSQTDFITNFFWRTKQLLYFPRLISSNAIFRSEGYRKVKFSKSENIQYGFAKFLYRFIFSKWGFGDTDDSLFLPKPSELGLDTNPTHEIV